MLFSVKQKAIICGNIIEKERKALLKSVLRKHVILISEEMGFADLYICYTLT